MADTLFSSAEAKAQLDPGVVAKLSKAAEASSLLTVTAQGTVMGVQWRRVAEAAELSVAEMGALRDWIEEIHSQEAADRFSSASSAGHGGVVQDAHRRPAAPRTHGPATR